MVRHKSEGKFAVVTFSRPPHVFQGGQHVPGIGSITKGIFVSEDVVLLDRFSCGRFCQADKRFIVM